jgi:glycosyltransferase involved in cell wall biosynthesis
MKIRAAHPQDVSEVIKAGIAYDSFKYVKHTGEVEHVDLVQQSHIYEQSIDKIVHLAEFDVIHAHDWLTCRAALRAKELTGKPLILHIHSIESDRAGHHGGGNPIVREVESLAMLIADKVIAVSEHTKRSIIREYNIPADKIEVVHNSISMDMLVPEDGDNAYRYIAAMKQQGYKVVASIGRLTIQKGLTNLLRAFRHVVDRNPKTLLLIVGSGDQFHELLELSAALGLSKNVIFTEFQRGKRYRDAYTIADLFVMPSVSEPFGLTPLESIGYGTPTLISKQSGVSEVITNCLKVDFWDEKEMANQITAVVRSEGLGKELHHNSLKEYERLSWDRAARDMFNIYSHHKQKVVTL